MWLWYIGIDVDVAAGGGDKLLERLLHELRHLSEFLKGPKPPKGSSGGDNGTNRAQPDPTEDHTKAVPDSGISESKTKLEGETKWRQADRTERQETQARQREAEKKR